MFHLFTTHAISTVCRAQEEAARLGHNHVSTEALLLGLIGGDATGTAAVPPSLEDAPSQSAFVEEVLANPIRSKNTGEVVYAAEGVIMGRTSPVVSQTSIASQILSSMGVDLIQARAEVEKILGRGSDKIAVERPLTGPAHRVIGASQREAQALGCSYIATTHLLLALLKQEASDEKALAVLKHFGVNMEDLQRKLVEAQSLIENEDPLPSPKVPTHLKQQAKVKCKIEKTVPGGYEVSADSLGISGFMSHTFDGDSKVIPPGKIIDAWFIGTQQGSPQFRWCPDD